jgi:hypothetical protein
VGDWRAPLSVKLEPDYKVALPGEESSVRGYMTRDAMERLRRGMGCCWCFSPLPGWPCAQNLRSYSEVDWNLPHRTTYEILDLIIERKCVVCGGEVTPEVFARHMEFGAV